MKSDFRRNSQVGMLVVVLAAVMIFATATSKSNASTVTFTKNVAPILFKNCAECHRPGEIAPMSLMTYQEVRPWAKSNPRTHRRGFDAAVERRSEVWPLGE